MTDSPPHLPRRRFLQGLAAVAALPGCKRAPRAAGTTVASPLYPSIAQTLAGWQAMEVPETVAGERQEDLRFLADWIVQRLRADKPADLLFVCTHNSRRSHMAAVWAQAAAYHLGLPRVRTWSGGTESTAFNPRAVTALRTHGVPIESTGKKILQLAPPGVAARPDNAVYKISWGPDLPATTAFSKRYTHPDNPEFDFGAVMVCSAADASCPTVEGALVRVAVPYLDPKSSDGSPAEAATYLAKSQEIGREMLWLMQDVTRKLGR